MEVKIILTLTGHCCLISVVVIKFNGRFNGFEWLLVEWAVKAAWGVSSPPQPYGVQNQKYWGKKMQLMGHTPLMGQFPFCLGWVDPFNR